MELTITIKAETLKDFQAMLQWLSKKQTLEDLNQSFTCVGTYDSSILSRLHYADLDHLF